MVVRNPRRARARATTRLTARAEAAFAMAWTADATTNDAVSDGRYSVRSASTMPTGNRRFETGRIEAKNHKAAIPETGRHGSASASRAVAATSAAPANAAGVSVSTGRITPGE